MSAYNGYKVPDGLIEDLKAVGHKYKTTSSKCNAQGIFVESEGKIHAMSDPRKHVLADGF